MLDCNLSIADVRPVILSLSLFLPISFLLPFAFLLQLQFNFLLSLFCSYCELLAGQVAVCTQRQTDTMRTI